VLAPGSRGCDGTAGGILGARHHRWRASGRRGQGIFYKAVALSLMNWMGTGFVVGSMSAAGALLQHGDRDAGVLLVLVGAALLAVPIFYMRKHDERGSR
jgi:hypothetical protein